MYQVVNHEHFIGIARPRRENWLQSITEDEKAVMAEHLSYVDKLFQNGEIVFTGACLDGAFGIVVYKAESKEEALKLFEDDPLVKSNIANTEFHPFRTGHIQGS